jgi:hypothetical protein
MKARIGGKKRRCYRGAGDLVAGHSGLSTPSGVFSQIDRQNFERMYRYFVTGLKAGVSSKACEPRAIAQIATLPPSFTSLRANSTSRAYPREIAKNQKRTQWIGELRRLLASVCLGALAPDLTGC